MKATTWSLPFEVKKVDAERHFVSGWLSVAVDKSGNLVVDSQGDVIEPAELERAAYEYVLASRDMGEMHVFKGVGRCVESMVFTVEKCRAMGIPDGILPQVAWWVTYMVPEGPVFQKIASGEYSEFSIGGSAVRQEVA
jgi:hypothetical protein